MPTATVAKPGFIDGSTRPFLTDADRAFFADNGYLVVENAATDTEIDELNRDATAICRGDYGSFRGWRGPHDDQTDEEIMRQYLCIHFPHKCSPIMHKYLSHPAIVETLTGVIGPDIKCMQSMLFIKAAGKPGQAWHQDEDYIPTRDRSLCGAWIALDDATIDNGCLWVMPGSHKAGVLYPQAQQDDPRFDCAAQSTRFPYTEADAVPVEVKRGAIVFFNGYLLHRSLPNSASKGFRRVLVNHYMSASSLLPWTSIGNQDYDTFIDEGRGVAKCDCREIVMIAGNDPYAWMGIKDTVKPHVRPSGEGGCAKSANDVIKDAN